MRAPAQLRVSLVELRGFRAGWVESYKTEEKKKKTKTEENFERHWSQCGRHLGATVVFSTGQL